MHGGSELMHSWHLRYCGRVGRDPSVGQKPNVPGLESSVGTFEQGAEIARGVADGSEDITRRCGPPAKTRGS